MSKDNSKPIALRWALSDNVEGLMYDITKKIL
jgi:hypothetical protein